MTLQLGMLKHYRSQGRLMGIIGGRWWWRWWDVYGAFICQTTGCQLIIDLFEPSPPSCKHHPVPIPCLTACDHWPLGITANYWCNDTVMMVTLCSQLHILINHNFCFLSPNVFYFTPLKSLSVSVSSCSSSCSSFWPPHSSELGRLVLCFCVRIYHA